MPALVLGHRGLVGQALMRRMPEAAIVKHYWPDRAEQVYCAAARVGGIGRNAAEPANMLVENLQLEIEVIGRCCAEARKLLFLGSSCIYPRFANRAEMVDGKLLISPMSPLKETDLMTGPLEPTNSAYAMAKLCGLEMCKAYRQQYGLKYVALMPCNLYGPGRFEQDTHVINMMMKRFHEAKLAKAPVVSVWGTGRPLREFMHVDDLAEACVHFMKLPEAEGELINVGTGEEVPIAFLAGALREIVGYRGDVEFDHTKPDGTPRKVLDCTKARSMGWSPKIGLRDGLERTYKEFCEWSRS